MHIRVPSVVAVAVPASLVALLSERLNPFPVHYASTYNYGIELLAESRPRVALLAVSAEQFKAFDELARDLRCTSILYVPTASTESIAKSIERELLATGDDHG